MTASSLHGPDRVAINGAAAENFATVRDAEFAELSDIAPDRAASL